MSDGRRSIWTTREGAMLAAACAGLIGLVIWGITSALQTDAQPAPRMRQPSADKKKVDPPQPQPPINLGNP